jgi:hypothetical protein
MNHYISAAKDFITTHRKKLVISTSIAITIIMLGVIIMLFIYNMPKDNYAAVNACNLFTPAKAEDMLGDQVININTDKPVVTGNTATSKCSYTDKNPDKNKMMVAAIAVRSGINNKGVQQNKTDFADNRPSEGIESVKNLGDSAYFDKAQGQLNILDGRKWIILSYGVGSTPETNMLGKAVELAKKVLH